MILVGRTERTLRETAVLLPGGPDRSLVATCDVSAPESVDALRDGLIGEDIGLLVNNAGIGGPVKPVTDIAPAEWDEVFSANVRSVYLMCLRSCPPCTCVAAAT